MTDARLPGHWLHDPTMDGLSDRAWRTYVGSLMWSAEHGTDGYLPTRALRLLHPEGVDDATAAELVAAGRWEPLPDGYRVRDWPKHQSLAEVVEWQRERNRLKNAALRARERAKRDEESEPVTGEIPGQLSGHVTGHTGRTGQARTGSEVERELAGTSPGAHATNEGIPPCSDCGTPNPYMAIAGRCRTCQTAWLRRRRNETARA